VKILDRPFSRLSAQQLHDIVRLRIDIFVVEQDCVYPDLDGRDTEPTTRHFWIEDDVGVTAYARLLDDGDARRIGRVVPRPDARGGGVARAMVCEVIDRSAGPWVLDAQSYLVGWYRDLGFTETGEEFMDAGIAHVPMRREIAVT